MLPQGKFVYFNDDNALTYFKEMSHSKASLYGQKVMLNLFGKGGEKVVFSYITIILVNNYLFHELLLA